MQQLPRDLTAIVSVSDPVLRNLQITQRYHDLSAALGEVIGQEDVNWSTFATWASKTAGESIRNEEVPAFVRDLVGATETGTPGPFAAIRTAIKGVFPPANVIGSLLLGPVTSTLTDVSANIARGNLKVFAELAPQFARFVATFQSDVGGAAPADSAKLDAYLAPFSPGPPESGGQELLVKAFTAYHSAIFERNPTKKARLIFLANCLIGLHEQTRLQPDIEAALDAPIGDVLLSHLHRSLKDSAPVSVHDSLIAAVERPALAVVPELETLWERIATRYLMRLALPGGQVLALGRDIPHRAAARDFLPEALKEITDPSDLVKLLDAYDRARADSGEGSASVDWAKLPDRMNFIVNLFRSAQQETTLFGPPFTPEQRAAFEAGTIPHGLL